MRHAAVAGSLLFLAITLSAATFDLPTDAELLGRADVVVVATVMDSTSREGANGMIFTDHRLLIEQTLKGDVHGTIVVSDAGGFANGHGVIIAGSARYESGERVLAFLTRSGDDTYFTSFMGLGKYRFARIKGTDLLVRDADGVETTAGEAFDARIAEEFIDAIEDATPDRAMRVTATIDREWQPQSNATALSYVMSTGRWPGCELGCLIGFFRNGSQPGVANSETSIENAMDVWNSDPNSEIVLALGSTTATTTVARDGENTILLNNTNPIDSGICPGAIACGIARVGGDAYTFNGESFFPYSEADVVIRPSVSASSFEAVMAHELGHTIGLRHSNEAGRQPNASNALMNSTTPSGAFLRRWDRMAVSTVYGDGWLCESFAVTGTSGGGTRPFGEPAVLSVLTSAPTDAATTRQWYEGASGNTSTPVGTTTSYTTPPIAVTRQYWVRVTLDCGTTADSSTITVTPAACTPPEITTEPTSRRINPNTTTTLNVTATGSGPLFHQWYRANTVGDTTNLVGGNSSSFTTPSLQNDTSYWVRVSNNCGQDDSALATVTVSSTCVAPSVTTLTPSSTINTGQGATLAVTAAGDAPFTYQWYTGDSPDQTNPVAGATNPTFAAGPFNTAGIFKYWVRIANSCGHVNSVTVTITVTPTCIPPTIANASSNVTALLGEGATISVLPAGGTPFTFQWYEGAAGDPARPIAGATSASYAAGPLNTAGTFPFWVLVQNPCGQVGSATINITVGCPPIVLPLVSSPAMTNSTTSYDVSWTGDLAVTPSFELQEATDATFTANLRSFSVPSSLSRTIPAHNEITTDTRFYYRARAISGCTGQPSDWSLTTSTVVTAPQPGTSSQFAISVPQGTTQTFVQDYLVPGFGETATQNDTFAITVDAPWITVFPPSGALSAGGTTVQFTISPAGLGAGSKTATVAVQRNNPTAAGGVSTHNGPTTSYVPFGLSLVTPVSPDPRDGNPPPGTLIIPAVAHAQGIGSPFRSDVRIVNVSFDSIDYEISYTASQTDGTQQGKKTTVTIAAGDTLAFDDIVSSWYGAGLLGEGGVGTIEIRPLNSSNPLDTFASSRTYAIDGGGTLGQFIPALRLDSFVGNIAQDTLGRISLQQVANSAAYRTNVGFVEGSGAPVSILAKLLDGNNNVLAQTTRELAAFGHFQTSMTGLFGNISLEDGRVEVEVTSTGGKVSAYASVLNNNTNDPLMIFPVQPARTTAARYVLAGISEFVSGDRNFHSDMRIYNGGTQSVTVTLNYYDQGQTAPNPLAAPVLRTIQANQVLSVNDVLPTLWPGIVGGGSVVATAPNDSSLVLTAQTFSREPDGGTKGQFIPGVTRSQSVGLGERAMEVLQLEESNQYRSNVGFVEVTGNAATIEIGMYEPDTKTSSFVSYPLKANEYVQFNRILDFRGQLGTVYNGRVSVKVVEGQGRVYAYGSVIDNRTEDPTYVPGQ